MPTDPTTKPGLDLRRYEGHTPGPLVYNPANCAVETHEGRRIAAVQPTTTLRDPTGRLLADAPLLLIRVAGLMAEVETLREELAEAKAALEKARTFQNENAKIAVRMAEENKRLRESLAYLPREKANATTEEVWAALHPPEPAPSGSIPAQTSQRSTNQEEHMPIQDPSVIELVRERLQQPIEPADIFAAADRAMFTATRVGAPGCEVRGDAVTLLAILQDYGRLRAEADTAAYDRGKVR